MSLRPTILWRAVVALCWTLSAASTGVAQSRSLDIERFRPAPDRDGFLGIPGTRTPGPWGWNTSLWLGYQSEPLTLRRVADDTRLPIVSHRVSAELITQLGLFDRISTVLRVPVVVWQQTDHTPLGDGPALAAVAFRDPYVATRVRIVGDVREDAQLDRNEGEGIALQVGATLPFGLEDGFAGEGSPQLEGMVLADFHFLQFGVGGMIGYRHRFAEPRLLGVPFSNEIFFGLAVEVPTILVNDLSALVEVRATAGLDQEAFSSSNTAVEGQVGARWVQGDLALTWAVGMGFTSGVGVPGFRGNFGIEFAPRTHDQDADGIVDDADGCPRLPEDFDGFEDEDGCPDPDNDGDLVPDEDDRCPLEPADFERDADEDGCTDEVVDADDDGRPDDADICPDEAEDVDGFEDEDGCPDPDDDADGVPDADDRCRREPEDRDGFEDEDGCPDPDDDGDGVPDADDGCRGEPEDVDGFEDEDGCPDPDGDRDGVLDSDESCAEEREDIDGVQDDDGCPERGGRALWRSEGAQDPPALVGRVRFAADGSVRPMSIPAVDQLARHLIARWGARWAVRIAQTDAPARAALQSALIGRGVPAERFEVMADEGLGRWQVRVQRRHEAARPSAGEPDRDRGPDAPAGPARGTPALDEEPAGAGTSAGSDP